MHEVSAEARKVAVSGGSTELYEEPLYQLRPRLIFSYSRLHSPADTI